MLTCITTDEGQLTIATWVRVHTWFGRAYMLPVALAHRLIVRVTLYRMARALRG